MNEQQLEKKSKREVLLEKGVDIFASILSSFPGGNVISTIGLGILNFNNEVKQKNLLAFVEEIKNFCKKNKEICDRYKEFKDKSGENKEEFEEIFFYIMEKAKQIISDKKRKIFARILFKEFTGTVKTDFNRIFLEIISQIDEKEIEILGKLRKIKEEATKEVKKVNKDKKIDKDKHLNKVYLNKIYNVLDNIEKIFEISKELYNFYIQDLISKSLVIDESMKIWDTKPLEIVKITNFGIDFLRYIEDV